MSAAVALLVLLGPIAMVFVALRIADRAEALRWDAIERQIAVTDAIHRELGAIVAPTVTRVWRGRWQVRVAVPFERPALVSRVLAIAHDTLARYPGVGGSTCEFVLVAQVPAPARKERAGSRCAFDGAPRLVPAGPHYEPQPQARRA